MSRFLLVLCIPLLLATRCPESPLIYDFEVPAAGHLAGNVQATYTVRRVPLEITAGTFDPVSGFMPGNDNAVLSVIPPGTLSVPEAGGLGVNSLIDNIFDLFEAATCLPPPVHNCEFGEALRFDFHPRFVPTTVTFRTFGDVTSLLAESAPPEIGPMRVPVENSGSSGSGPEVFLHLRPGIASLVVGPAAGTDPALFVANIAGEIGMPVDIAPRSCPNTLRDTGKVRVAVLGDENVDVRWINLKSVRLVGAAPRRVKLKDVATVSLPLFDKADETDCSDAGKDGFLDAEFTFDAAGVIDAMEASLEEAVLSGDIYTVVLEGRLVDGTPFIGEDVIVVSRGVN